MQTSISTAETTPSEERAHRTKLRIRDFAHIRDANIDFGDLTVLVGPQGAGKSLVLQWLKVAMDGKQIAKALREAGHPTQPSSILVDLIFGSGMAPSWREGESSVQLNEEEIHLSTIEKIGDGKEKLFFVPAHRSSLISDGWAAPFQKLNAETPVVARLFSQTLFEKFSGKNTGTLFPVSGRLKQEIREAIDSAVFHGGRVGIEQDAQHALRLRLIHENVHLPFMTWTAGQREFTPLLLGLYGLMPSSNLRKRKPTDWVVIEEPEMGLHPQAITAFMLLVLDLLWRGYRVVLSTHSPHILTMLWMMRHLQSYKARWQLVCDAFDISSPKANMGELAQSALTKDYRAYLMEFDEDGRVQSFDISALDPSADDERIAGWGGLTTYSSRFGDAVRRAVNEAE